MFNRIVNKLIALLFKLEFYRFIDIFRKHYQHSKALVLKKEFNTLGENYQVQEPSYIINPKYISIGNDFVSLFNLRLEAYDNYGTKVFNPKLIIGNNVRLGSDCHIGCINEVIISDNVLIASKVYISDHHHGEVNAKALEKIPLKRELYSPGSVIIEEGVWIGEGVVVLPGITIGKNSIIGANSVVTKNVPINTVVAGVPAKVLRVLI
jgi:acetyltransferase-like isoleucine patch superfamily enzyme